MITSAGVWTSATDEKEYTYVTLTSSEYPTRFLTSLLGSFKQRFYDNNPAAKEDVPTKVDTCFLKELVTKYNDPTQWDKVAEAQQKVEEIKLQLQDNLHKMASTDARMMELEGQTFEMRNQAHTFEKGSDEMHTNMYSRNCKIGLVIACIFLAAVLYLLLPIICSSTK